MTETTKTSRKMSNNATLKESDESMKLEAARLIRLLHQAHFVVLNAREKELKKFRISFAESQVLYAITTLGGNTTVSEISQLSTVGYHTIAALVNRMQKRGLIKKESDPGKKRLWRVVLTEKGKTAALNASKRESITDIISVFSEKERNQLTELLKKMRDSAIRYSMIQQISDF